MGIGRNLYKTECNLLGRPNVINIPDPSLSVTETNYFLFLTLNNLTLSKPNWRFKIVDYTSFNQTLLATGFDIYEDDEKLGKVRIEYKGRYEKIKVQNKRIDDKRDRGTGYYTDDPAKAELSIRKHFFKKAKDERMDDAITAARQTIHRQNQNKHWVRNEAKTNVLTEAHAFVQAHMEQYLAEFPAMTPRYETYKRAEAQWDVTRNVRDAFDNRATTLVVLDGTQYLTQVGDEITAYNDETLPYDLRKKIGLLKLVEDTQMISDVGCRVADTIFVLMPEADEKEHA